MYDEINRQVKKLPPGGLKKYTHSLTVTDDEIYFFNRVLHPPKVGRLTGSFWAWFKWPTRINLESSVPFVQKFVKHFLN